MRRRSPFHLTIVVVALATGLVLTGCGSSTTPPAGAPDAAAQVTDDRNDADVAFVQQMIPHHGQALAIAELAADRAASDAVRDLARAIESAQGPEITAMTGWLRAWGEQVPDPHSASSADGQGAHGMDADAHAHGGLLTADQLAELEVADGAAWDRMFLTAMLAHHRGAVAMAEEQLAAGRNPDALALAQAVVDGQTAEIETMEDLVAGETPVAAPTLPADAAHIHGIGRNPADGVLYVGTHTGLYTVDGSGAAKVGDATIDLMGFVVAGPGHFYASGHPGPGDALPDPVGLIETRDGGHTWHPLSLTGESDFHALASDATSRHVYAYDGALRTSADGGRTWRTSSADVQPAAVAAAPDEPGTVLATTQSGLQRSVDGGVTFAAVDGAPVMVFLAWGEDTTVWGVDPLGVLHRSGDAGRTWTRAGATGAPPQAITADSDGVTVATTSRILVSPDGRTFSTVATTGAP